MTTLFAMLKLPGILRVGVCAFAYIAIGLLLSLLVAWGIVWHHWSAKSSFLSVYPKVRAASELDQDGHGWRVSYWYEDLGLIHVVERSDSFYDMRGYGEVRQLQGKFGRVPEWSRARRMPTKEEKQSYRQRLEVVAGWPFPSWFGEYTHQNHAYDSEESECAFIFHPNLGVKYSLVLPYKPFFPGALWSMAFYSILVMSAHLIIKRISRLRASSIYNRRTEQDQCVSCAYDITGLTTCPECGQGVMVNTHKASANDAGE